MHPPAAAALAGAKAAELLGLFPSASRPAHRIYQERARGRGFPGCADSRIKARLPGICGKNPENGLWNLSSLTDNIKKGRGAANLRISRAREGRAAGIQTVRLFRSGHSSECEIIGEHTRFTLLKKTGSLDPCAARGEAKRRINAETSAATDHPRKSWILPRRFPLDVRFLLEGARINMALAEHAASTPYGLSGGESHLRLAGHPATLAEPSRGERALPLRVRRAHVRLRTRSGDQLRQRQSWAHLLVPVQAVAEYLGSTEETTVRALCVSHTRPLSLTAKKEGYPRCAGRSPPPSRGLRFSRTCWAGCASEGHADSVKVANLTGMYMRLARRDPARFQDRFLREAERA
jgi:hypothetical protein